MDLNTLAGWAQIISIPLAIIAIAVSIWLYRRGKQKRDLVCFFDAIEAPIEIKMGEALKGNINIFYEGRSIDNLFVVRANVVNQGNLSIRSSDILDPLTFVYKDNAELMRKPQIIKSTPGNLKVTCTTQSLARGSISNVAITEFELLNSGESFTVEMLCTGQTQHPSVSCRVDGLKQVQVMTKEELERRKLRRSNILMTAAFILGLVLAIVLVVVFPGYSTFSAYVELMTNIMFILAMLFMLRQERKAR